MTVEELEELSKRTRSDGKRLFNVCEFVYFVSIISNWFIGIVGITASIVLMMNGGWFTGLGVALGILTFFCCLTIYLLSVVSTHIGKVLAHISFSNIAFVENRQS